MKVSLEDGYTAEVEPAAPKVAFTKGEDFSQDLQSELSRQVHQAGGSHFGLLETSFSLVEN